MFNVNLLNMENFQKLNRLKAVLADAGQTNKWLAEQLGKNPVTVSKWCTNTSQPDLQTLCLRLTLENFWLNAIIDKCYEQNIRTHI